MSDAPTPLMERADLNGLLDATAEPSSGATAHTIRRSLLARRTLEPELEPEPELGPVVSPIYVLVVIGALIALFIAVVQL